MQPSTSCDPSHLGFCDPFSVWVASKEAPLFPPHFLTLSNKPHPKIVLWCAKKQTRAAQSTSSSLFTVKRQPPYRPYVRQLKRETPWASIHPPHVILSLWTRTGCSCSSIFIVAPVQTEPIRTHSTYPQLQSKTQITKTDSEFPFLTKPVCGPLPHHNSLSISPCMRLRLEKITSGCFFD